ncbi:MAG: RDD family protein [Gammaproteobacteria bacterium]
MPRFRRQNNPIKPGDEPPSSPGFFRRMAAIIYDLFLLAGILFAATAVVLPFNAGAAFTSQQYLYPVYLLAVSFIFFGWFWTHGGQTLGMRAWKIKLLTTHHEPIGWIQALIRFIAALASWGFFGLGFFWIVIDKQRRGWHDYLSGTAIFFETASPGR